MLRWTYKCRLEYGAHVCECLEYIVYNIHNVTMRCVVNKPVNQPCPAVVSHTQYIIFRYSFLDDTIFIIISNIVYRHIYQYILYN
jgi:hypothetical protein